MSINDFYPPVLEKHQILFFPQNEVFQNARENQLVSAYYHVDDFPLNMHYHDFYELNIVTAGRGRHYIESQSFHVEEGCIFVIPPNIYHGYWSFKNLSIFHLLLSNDFLRTYRHELGTFDGYNLLFEIEPLLRTKCSEKAFLKLNPSQKDIVFDLLSTLAKYQNDSYKGIHTMQNALSIELIGRLCMYITKAHRNERSSSVSYEISKIISAMEYINDNYSQKLSISMLAKNCSMSRSTFIKYFKDIVHCTPAEYINNCRLQNAKKMLETSDLSIVEIALECGFFDSSHFIKHFSTAYSETPKQYRTRSKINT